MTQTPAQRKLIPLYTMMVITHTDVQLKFFDDSQNVKLKFRTLCCSGNLPPKERAAQWISKRVFFLTPQVMQNDITKGACPADLVRCVVFDEAHKALGNYSYCQVGSQLSPLTEQRECVGLYIVGGEGVEWSWSCLQSFSSQCYSWK